MNAPNEFFGENVPHVRQPRHTALCFTSLIAGYAETSVATAHTALMDQNISFKDGSTTPMIKRKIIPIKNTIVTMDPINTPVEGTEDVDELVDIIDTAHRDGYPVAMLYKKTDIEPGTEIDFETEMDPHWITLCGFFENEDGEKVQIAMNDPENMFTHWIEPIALEAMIERSIPTTGLYAYALSKAGVESPAGPAS